MLKVLRKKGVMKKVLWVVAVVIIISFGFFGTANYLNRRRGVSYAGHIFGRKISFDDFTDSYAHTRNQAILRYGDNFYRIQERLDLVAETWDRLILLHEAKKRNIRVSDQEVVAAIQDFEFFKRDSQFDQELYDIILRRVFQTQPRNFEEGIRESLLFQKLYEQETENLALTDEEIKEQYRLKNEKVQVSYILFLTDDFKKQVNLDQKEVENYFLEHKEDFRSPDAINLQYIEFAFPAEATDDQKAAIALKAQSVFDQLIDQEDFEAVSQTNGLKIQESGFFSRENPKITIGWSMDLLQKAFALKAGEFSDPIETPQGYYILKFKEKRNSYIPELKEAQPNVKQVLILQKASLLAQEKANEMLAKTKERRQAHPDEPFGDLAKNLGLSIEQTTPFMRGEYIPKIGLDREFQEATFSLNKDRAMSEVIKTSKGYSIMHFDDLIGVDDKKFDEEKEEFAAFLLEQKKNQAFTRFILELRLKARLEDHISQMKKEQE
ncbi:MAG: SurA N-terminal domain-containing protein [Candidatus Omnitrophota bacterium]